MRRLRLFRHIRTALIALAVSVFIDMFFARDIGHVGHIRAAVVALTVVIFIDMFIADFAERDIMKFIEYSSAYRAYTVYNFMIAGIFLIAAKRAYTVCIFVLRHSRGLTAQTTHIMCYFVAVFVRFARSGFRVKIKLMKCTIQFVPAYGATVYYLLMPDIVRLFDGGRRINMLMIKLKKRVDSHVSGNDGIFRKCALIACPAGKHIPVPHGVRRHFVADSFPFFNSHFQKQTAVRIK